MENDLKFQIKNLDKTIQKLFCDLFLARRKNNVIKFQEIEEKLEHAKEEQRYLTRKLMGLDELIGSN